MYQKWDTEFTQDDKNGFLYSYTNSTYIICVKKQFYNAKRGCPNGQPQLLICWCSIT